MRLASGRVSICGEPNAGSRDRQPERNGRTNYLLPLRRADLTRSRASSGSLASGAVSSGPGRSGFSRMARRSNRIWRAKPAHMRHIIRCIRTSIRRRSGRSRSIDSETSPEISRQRNMVRSIPISQDEISCIPSDSDGLGGAGPRGLTRKPLTPYNCIARRVFDFTEGKGVGLSLGQSPEAAAKGPPEFLAFQGAFRTPLDNLRV